MLTQKITDDLTKAMRTGDARVRDTLRMLQSVITNEAIALKKKDKGLTDEEVGAVLRRAIKQRRESAQQYRDGNRPELAEKEDAERAILEQYLPAQMSADDLRAIVRRIMDESDDFSAKGIGKVIGRVMGEVKGQADGAQVRMIVEQECAARRQ